MKEKYQKYVDIECIDKNSMNNLIEYIYTGTIVINNENVGNLLAAANYLQIEDVKLFCLEFLEQAISLNNCFVILAIEDRYQSKSLKTHKWKWTIGHGNASTSSTTTMEHNIIKKRYTDTKTWPGNGKPM